MKMANRKFAVTGTLVVEGVEYVVIPKAAYLRLRHVRAPLGAVDARSFVRQSLAEGLRAAREHAKLTQADLAELLGKSQTMVSQAESGVARVSERYVRTVLEACGLPADWSGKRGRNVPRKKTA
jgi:ribosome-binding protein aMBF1 (putative translation factor)